MPTYQFFDTGTVEGTGSTAGTWAGVQAGSGLFADTVSKRQMYSVSTFAANQSFLQFDTSSIPDGEVVTAATLSIYSTSAYQVDAGATLEAYTSVASPVSGTTWKASGSMTTLLASRSGTGVTLDAYNAFTSSGSNLANAVDKTGITYIVLTEIRVRNGSAPPPNAIFEFEVGGSHYPKLDVTTVLGGGSMLMVF